MKSYVGSLLLLSASFFSSIGMANDDMGPCQLRIENRAIFEFAEQNQVSVKDVLVLRFEMGAWTEMTKNNHGAAQVALGLGKRRLYLHVGVRQIGDTENCKVTNVETIDPETVSPLARQSENYKLAIRDTIYSSEGDSPWFAFYSSAVVREKSLADVRVALNAGDEQVAEWSHEEVMEFLDDYIQDVSNADRFAYAQLKKALLKDFKELRGYKVGEPDSGPLDLYIVGRTKDGKLVGVRTVDVET